MKIIEDEYYEINIRCKPLRRNLYRYDETITKNTHTKQGTSALRTETPTVSTAIPEPIENQISEFNLEEPIRKDEGTADTFNNDTDGSAGNSKVLVMTEEDRAAFDNNEKLSAPTSPKEVAATQSGKKENRLKKLEKRTRLSDRIWDYSEIEKEEIEESVAEAVNSDGYYDEVEPFDINEEHIEQKINKKPLLIVFGALIVFLAIVFMQFKSIV